MRRHDRLRAGLGLLAGTQVLLGLWILLPPEPSSTPGTWSRCRPRAARV